MFSLTMRLIWFSLLNLLTYRKKKQFELINESLYFKTYKRIIRKILLQLILKFFKVFYLILFIEQ